MLELALKLFGSALDLWVSKEKHKYQDEYRSLREQIYAEQNKDPAHRSDAVLDNLNFRLRVLIDSFCAVSGKPDA